MFFILLIALPILLSVFQKKQYECLNNSVKHRTNKSNKDHLHTIINWKRKKERRSGTTITIITYKQVKVVNHLLIVFFQLIEIQFV